MRRAKKWKHLSEYLHLREQGWVVAGEKPFGFVALCGYSRTGPNRIMAPGEKCPICLALSDKVKVKE